MSGLVVTADLCAAWQKVVRQGWRGSWPCGGEQLMRSGDTVIGLIECSCSCHLPDGAGHRMPRLADRTAVHPTDVLTEDPAAFAAWVYDVPRHLVDGDAGG